MNETERDNKATEGDRTETYKETERDRQRDSSRIIEYMFGGRDMDKETGGDRRIHVRRQDGDLKETEGDRQRDSRTIDCTRGGKDLEGDMQTYGRRQT